MIKKIFSMKAAVVVMLIFAAAIGYATFIENDYGTQTARALVYNAKWFEILLFYFISILTYNIFAYKMYKRAKWGQLILHVAFIFIAVGALITRYIGYEGILHLRESQTSNKMVSDKMYLSVIIAKDGKRFIFDREMTLSSVTKNRVKEKIRVDNKDIDIELLKYLPSAKVGVVEVKNGKEFLELMVARANTNGKTLYLEAGESLNLGGVTLSFDSNGTKKDGIVIKKEGDRLLLVSSKDIATKSMATLQDSMLKPGVHELRPQTLYRVGQGAFVFKKYYKSAKREFVSNSLKSDGIYPQMIELQVSSGSDSKIVRLFGSSGNVGDYKRVALNGLDLSFSYGAKVIPLPFTVTLEKFKLERYPGSMSPSSYSSWVRVKDLQESKNFKYHIYMNHVLDYRGYRFFQSSYDTDERGSILSVNHDPGTLPTYIGYLLLTIGFIWSFLSNKGRVAILLKKLEKLDKKSVASIVLFLGLFSSIPLKSANVDTSLLTKDEIKQIQSVDLNHSEKFARLIVQDNSGRMEPLDTLAKEVVRKISSKSGFLGLNYNQIFIGMIVEPNIYNKLRFIKIAHPLLNKKLGLPKSAKYASMNDFFSKSGQGSYKIEKDLAKARKKRAALRSKYDNELIKVDEKLNVLYMTQQGYLLKLFPKPNDPNNTWYNPLDALKAFPAKEGQVVRYIIGSYLKSASEALKSGNWQKANNAVDVIRNFQKFYGSKIMPLDQKVEAEIFYNRLDIFVKLSFAYVLIGFVLLVIAFVSIVKPKIKFRVVTKIALFLLILTLIAHTVGLILRWYIAEHAPWSNAYESILYIAWATALAGFVFAKRSPLAFAATSILAGIFLFVAFLSSLNPQITNLVPVLKSYWLMIHVAVITASYGFLGLGALLGFLNLILFIVHAKSGSLDIKNAIRELTIIIEITLLIGLALITIGNFLGGVWANESWGRYWGWDPKETWAAVTILVYAAVVHMRFIPKLNSIYAFNVAALLAYFSVIMTYFGVNYYLSGMHSYAAGDPVPIPAWVYPAVVSIFLLIGISWKYRIKEKL